MKIETIKQLADAVRAMIADATVKNKTLCRMLDDNFELWRDEVPAWDNEINAARAICVDGDILWIDTEQGCAQSCEIAKAAKAGEVSRGEIIAHMRDYDTGDVEFAEFLAQGGVDGDSELAPVDEDFEGACRVWCEPQYYGGHCNAPVAGFARDDKNEIMEFATRAEAQAYVDNYYNAPSSYDGVPACNVLSHGQAGADTLTIVEAP